MRLTPHATLPHVANNIKSLETLVNVAFQQRRKTLRNSLQGLLDVRQIAAAGVDPGARPETLDLKAFAALSAMGEGPGFT